MYDLIQEYYEAFSLCDEVETWSNIEARLKLHDEALFFACPYAIKEEQKLVAERKMNDLEKVGINKNELT